MLLNSPTKIAVLLLLNSPIEIPSPWPSPCTGWDYGCLAPVAILLVRSARASEVSMEVSAIDIRDKHKLTTQAGAEPGARCW